MIMLKSLYPGKRGESPEAVVVVEGEPVLTRLAHGFGIRAVRNFVTAQFPSCAT